MIFSDSTGKTGIVEDCDFLVNTDSTSYPIEQKTRNANRKMDEVVSIILQSDGRWEWDDTNNTDLPIGTTSLVDQQQDYNIAGGTFLRIDRVEVKDINGNYYLLYPISEKNITDQALTEFEKTPGRPLYYDKLGDSIFLYPKPSSANVTTASGLKVYFQRLPSYFAATDTTKSPGFNPLFHRLISMGMALDYAIQNEMNGKINILTPLIAKMETNLVEFYTTRSRDEHISMTVRSENYGQEDQYGGSGRTPSDKVAFY